MCYFWEGVVQNLIGTSIGVFIGFGLEVLLQKCTEKKAKQAKFKKVMKAINDELEEIYGYLKSVDESAELAHRIQTPSWDSSLYSAMFLDAMSLDMIGSPKYNDYIGAYSSIKAINDCIGNEKMEQIPELLEGFFDNIEKLDIER